MSHLLNHVAFDQLDLVTYEEVVKQENFRRKTLVLLGTFSLSFEISKICSSPFDRRFELENVENVTGSTRIAGHVTISK